MLNALYFGSKFLQELVYPFNLALAALLLAAWCQWRGTTPRARRWGLRWTLTGFVLLFVSGAGITNELLTAPLETWYPVVVPEKCPEADAIVVLGGTTLPTRAPRREAEEANGNRLTMAARLFKLGKAKKVIVSGGGDYKLPPRGTADDDHLRIHPDTLGDGDGRTEADDMADVLVQLGVPAAAVVKEDRSRTTYENAKRTLELLAGTADAPAPGSGPRILLVTSAAHLPRSVGLFEKRGFRVVPVPTCFRSGMEMNVGAAVKPTASGVAATTFAWKEWLGMAAYRLLGRM